MLIGFFKSSQSGAGMTFLYTTCKKKRGKNITTMMTTTTTMTATISKTHTKGKKEKMKEKAFKINAKTVDEGLTED